MRSLRGGYFLARNNVELAAVVRAVGDVAVAAGRVSASGGRIKAVYNQPASKAPAIGPIQYGA